MYVMDSMATLALWGLGTGSLMWLFSLLVQAEHISRKI